MNDVSLQCKAALGLLFCLGLSFAFGQPSNAPIYIPAGGMPVAVPAPEPLSPDAPPKSRVVLVERPDVVHNFSIDSQGVAQMWHDGLLKFTKQPDETAALHALGITPSDVVGIKINANLGDTMSTRPALVTAIAHSLITAGVPAGQIIVWDKSLDGMSENHYGDRHERPFHLRSVIPQTGFDPKVFYTSEYAGKLIWGDLLFRGKLTRDRLLQQADASVDKKLDPDGAQTSTDVSQQELQDQVSNRSYLAKLVTQTCTKLINVPVMVDNGQVGIDGCLANLALDSVDNNRRFLSDGINGDPAIAEILDRDLFRKKVVLHVMDGLIAQYAGGPTPSIQYTQSIGALYLSADPVAIDALVLKRLEAWRADTKVVPIGSLARHIKGAANEGLGTADLKQINLIKVQ